MSDPSPLSDVPIMHTVEERAHGWRLDHYLTRLYPNYSRALFQKAVSEGAITVNGLDVKPSRRLRTNDRLAVRLPTVPDGTIPPEPMDLDILYEDDALVVLNKPPGLIVHPGRGRPSGTLAAGLQFHFDQLSDVAGRHRPGIVHRLDRDTTGVLVIAKDNQIHHKLSRQFEARTVRKTYEAIVWGEVQFDSDWIETHICTHPKIRERMTVCEPGGEAREATTFYETVARFNGFSHVRMHPKTGRTHQLRVHMQHIGHPIIGDRAYGGRPQLTLRELGETADAAADEVLIDRQALHAARLQFDHPQTGKPVEFEAPLPEDMRRTLAALARYRPKQ